MPDKDQAQSFIESLLTNYKSEALDSLRTEFGEKIESLKAALEEKKAACEKLEQQLLEAQTPPANEKPDESSITELETVKAECESKVAAAVKDKNTAEATLNAQNAEIGIYKTTIEKDKEACAAYEKTISELEGRLHLLENERDALSTDLAQQTQESPPEGSPTPPSIEQTQALEEKDAKLAELDMQITALHEQVTTLTEGETARTAVIASQKETLGTLEKEVHLLRTQNETLQQTREEETALIAHATEQKKALEASFAKKLQGKDAEIQCLREALQIAQKPKQSEETDALRKELETLRATQEEEKVLIAQTLASQKKDKESFEGKLKVKDNEIQCLREALQVAQKTKAETPPANSEERDILTQKLNALEKAREEEKALVTHILATQKSDRASFESKLTVKNNEIQCLREALQIAQKSNAAKPDTVSEEITTLKNELDAMANAREEEKALITQVLANQKKDKETFDKKLKVKDNEIQCLREALKSAQNSQQPESTTTAAEEIHALEKKLQGKTMEIQCLREALAVKSSTPKSSTESEGNTGEITALKNQITALEKEKAVLEQARKEEQEMVKQLMTRKSKS